MRVYRYVAPGGDGDLRYVYSADASVSGEWTRQELAFYAYAKPQRNTVPVYRYLARGADGTARYLFSINPWLGNGWTREHVRLPCAALSAARRPGGQRVLPHA